MSLRRIERLLTEARYSSNTQDVDTITDKVLVYYCNRVQSMIEDALFVISGMNNIFMESYEITLVDGTEAYDLPFDCYGVNALKSVGVKRATSAGFLIDPIAFISEKEAGSKVGYSLKEDQIMLNFQNSVGYPINVNYVRKIPTIGKRFGAAITAYASGTATVGVTTDDLLVDFDDFFSTVDADGVIKTRNNRILTYTKATGVITFTAGTGTMANGQYVIPGKYATSHSQLPAECEKVFLEVLERRVAQRQSATDMNVISPLTDREIQLMTDVFSKGTDDNEVPPTPMYSEFI